MATGSYKRVRMSLRRRTAIQHDLGGVLTAYTDQNDLAAYFARWIKVMAELRGGRGGLVMPWSQEGEQAQPVVSVPQKKSSL